MIARLVYYRDTGASERWVDCGLWVETIPGFSEEDDELMPMAILIDPEVGNVFMRSIVNIRDKESYQLEQ